MHPKLCMNSQDPFPPRSTGGPRGTLSDRDRVQVLIEEYRALYGLLSFRLAAVDRRLPVAGGTLGAVLGSFSALPAETGLGVLLAMPAALAALLRTTVVHNRSKEDVLRRIDEIERQVNQIAGEELLAFQSRHPNRQRVVGGRSGRGTVLAVLGFCLSGVAACGYLFTRVPAVCLSVTILYHLYLTAIVLDMLVAVWQLSRYAYRKPPAGGCPLFVGRRWIWFPPDV